MQRKVSILNLSILNFVKKHPEGVDRGQVAKHFGISYWSARRRLETLAEKGYIRKTVQYKDKARRIVYFPIKRWARVKVRLYNETLEPTPEGQFQGFYEIDAELNELGLPVFTEISLEEIAIAKYHMWIMFNFHKCRGFPKWFPVEEKTLYDYIPEKMKELERKRRRLEELEKKLFPTAVDRAEMARLREDIEKERAIPFAEEKPELKYVRVKDFATLRELSDEEVEELKRMIEEEYAGKFSIEELVFAIGNRVPKEIPAPEMKIICERLLVIKDGKINWDSGEMNVEIDERHIRMIRGR